jgi:putative ABC transport system permease protein
VLASVPAGTDTAALATAFGDQASVMTRADALKQSSSPALQGTQQVGLTVLVVGLALLEAVLMAGAAFAVGARRSQRDLALVGAAGGDAHQVQGIVLSGGLVLGAVGGVVGTLVGLAVAEALLPYAPRLSHHVYAGTHPRLVELIGSALVGVVTGLLSAWLPARGAARAPIVASLTGRRGTVRSSARLTSLAICAAIAGTVIAAWAGRTSGLGGQQINAILFGAAVAELGFAGCAPALVGLAGRLAGRLPLAGRLSVRDIARNRTRTGPAVAAIMATLSGVVAMGVYVASSNAQAKADYHPTLPRNVVVLETNGGPLPAPAMVAAAASALPVKQSVDFQRSYDGKQAYVYGSGNNRSPHGGPPVDNGTQVTVTDPAMLSALGQTSAAAAVSRGAVSVDNPALVEDGRVTVTVNAADGSVSSTRSLPAVIAAIPANYELGDVFVSPATAHTLGLGSELNAVALVLTGPVKADDRDAARSLLLERQPPESLNAVNLLAESGLDNGKSLVVPLALLAISTLVTFGVTAISTALSASEGRPDLATLGAVGATPFLRRRLAMTQAAVLALLGGGLGILAGLVPMTAVIAVRSDVLTFTIPWQVIALSLVAVPALAALGAGAFTRSGLPLVRRLT